MTISIGDTLPDATFATPGAGGPESLDTQAVFGGRTVALFAVPGAFTPTCSARHLPGFRDQASALAAKGVEAIACVSVNDVFVMKAWGQSQELDDSVLLLADGNAAFTRAIGLDLDASKAGMGVRSQRYSMLVRDRVVTMLNVEDGAAFEVSSADYLLERL